MFKKGWFIAALITVLVLSLAACGGGGNNATEPAPADGTEQAPDTANGGNAGNGEGATGGDVSAQAQSLYNANCMACHATDLGGGGNFPSLQKIGAEHSAEEIAGIISNGRGGMPSFKDRLSEDDITVLSQWLAQKK
ncbi:MULTISPECIES: cytochrome c [Paenibacillus]|uniref:Cytochrome c class I n=2 Tax=Paenibacillus lactis TaxID=228574 RepID=G4HAK0_9BACL|nr:cytochrome c [Paenibacillus lactis]EHB66959.1 cytochrome c class I [Paenibacillus lactis 154]MBP1895373.1 cytochrome c551 [Paenibacillus lactis]MCM3492563.1 cytochrome c [Paenibacillus lactis]GIO89932.1 hypothetical protein J31TS3_11590 [Paenibacillus lactis]HAF97847.1 cytochrome c [Paenibacillus lactis]